MVYLFRHLIIEKEIDIEQKEKLVCNLQQQIQENSCMHDKAIYDANQHIKSIFFN